MFSDIYRHVQKFRDCPREIRLPRGVRKELQKWDGILPLLHRNLQAEWSDVVHAVDASEWGLGVTCSRLPVSEVRSLGQYNERWRFRGSRNSRPRDDAWASAGTKSLEEDLTSASRGGADFDALTAATENVEEFLELRDQEEQIFEPVPFEAVNREWRTTASFKWRRRLTLPVAEARSSLHAVKTRSAVA